MWNNLHYARAELQDLHPLEIVINGKKKCYVKEILEENKELVPILDIAREQALNPIPGVDQMETVNDFYVMKKAKLASKRNDLDDQPDYFNPIVPKTPTLREFAIHLLSISPFKETQTIEYWEKIISSMDLDKKYRN